MRVKSLLLGSAVALLCAAPASAGHFNGWYIGLEGGANWTSDNDAVWGAAAPPAGPVVIEFDSGWAVLGTVGYGFQGNWRVEGEVGYRANDVDAVVGATNRTGGELTATTLMANVLYDWELSDRWMLSFGAGAGVAHNQFDDGVLDQDEDYNFAYQGIAGLSYALSSRTDLTLNYRYMMTDDADFHGPHGGHTDFYETDGFENHAVTIGLRYDLSPDSTPIVAAPPPPPPPLETPQATAPAPKQFLVFFGFNKSNLTAEAQEVISQAAAAAKEYGSATIQVVGHADTVGSPQYNQKLSERRAGAVRGGLVANGIEGSKITASGRGETELLVQTGDNVKEPQNRRATVDLQ
jgi:OOP family OmpA-OmpF porin